MGIVEQILIVGADSAGLLAALNLKTKLPELRVEVLRQPMADDFQAAGFATTAEFPTYLHEDLGVPALEFLSAVLPTWRIRTLYQWGQKRLPGHTKIPG